MSADFLHALLQGKVCLPPKIGLKSSKNASDKAWNALGTVRGVVQPAGVGRRCGPALQGDHATLTLQSTLRGAVQQTGPASNAYARLPDIGLETQTNGTLKINEARLSAALARPAELARLFGGAASSGGTDASNQGFVTRLKATAAQLLGSGGLLPTRTQGLRDNIPRNKSEQQRYEARVDATKVRLTRQYTALDTTVNRISGTGSSLTQSLAALTALTNGIASGK